MQRREKEVHLRWLMILRVVAVTTLLISSLAIEIVIQPSQTVRPLFFLAAAAYAAVLLYAGLDRWLSGGSTFVYLQLIGDAVVITAFVWITGGIDSPMSFLYLLPVIVAAMSLYRTGAFVVAGACWALYAALICVPPPWLRTWSIPAAADPQPARLVLFLVVHLVALVAVAILSSYLSERLRLAGDALAERSGTVARLQALNENIIESINSGLVTTDEAGRINFINRGGVEITGHAPSRVHGRTVEDFFGLEAGFLGECRGRLRSKHRFRFERNFVTEGGTRIFLGIAVSNLYDRQGHGLGFIFIFQDLTEVVALEQEVRLKERMAALGEMAAGIAHEVRNPLAAISGAVQYLKGDLRPEGETLELMDIILRESERLDHTIRDFLTFARPGVFKIERVDVVRLLEDSVKLLRKSREFRSSHRIEAAYQTPEMWCGLDANRMKQVFWNLATNALKAMPDGGILRIRAGYRDAEEGAHGRLLEVGFEDHGEGMEPGELRGCFQPFRGSFREGTGLGMAIVYRLVEEHGGKIHVDSDYGEGTTVRVVIPSRDDDVGAVLAGAAGGAVQS